VNRHAKASSAGSSSAKTVQRFVLLAIATAALLAISSAGAAADTLTVTLSGSETGTVKSSPPGIECSNTPGHEKLSPADCTHEFTFLISVSLEAIPDSPGVFGHWTGNTFDLPPEYASTCNSGGTNPCSFLSLFETPTVNATFEPPPPPPVATTGGASEIKPFSARLEGEVNPEGHAVSTCRFEYGTTTEYGSTSPCKPPSLGSGTSPVAVSAPTSLIQPGTVYHYRLVAANPGGSSEGEDQTFTTAPAPPDECPNAARRAEQGPDALNLPSCMAFEQVSPPSKFNQYARQAIPTANGDRVYFQSVAALADTPRQGGIFDPYVAIRTNTQWVTSPTSPPADYPTGPLNTAVPCGFSPDLSQWNVLAATAPQGKEGVATAFQGGLGGSFLPISPTLTPIAGSSVTGASITESECLGSSVDTSHEFFRPFQTTVAWLPGDPIGSLSQNIYEAYRDESGTPTVELVNRDKDGVIVGGGCGAAIGTGGNIRARQGAISADASIVYLLTNPGQTTPGCDTANRRRVVKREMTGAGPVMSEIGTSECTRVSPPCDTTDANDLFMGASQEADKVLILTSRQLADSDLDAPGLECTPGNTGSRAGCDLYLYDPSRAPGDRLTQVSAGNSTDPTPGSGAEVLGVADFAGDGSRIYFVANGRLTLNPNRLGQTAQAGQPNLYMYERDEADPAGRTVFIGTLSTEDQVSGFAPNNNNQAQAVPGLGPEMEAGIGGDGHILAFVSKASLTPDDTDGGAADVYRYESEAGTLRLVSKAAPGGSDDGPGGVEVAPNFAEFSPLSLGTLRHWVSEDGSSIVFATPEALAPTDSDGGRSTDYLWRGNGLTAVAPYAVSMPPTISLDGSVVAFTTEAQLVRQDTDRAPDAYVAMPEGGFPFIEPAVKCSGEACQGPAATPPAGQGATSNTFVGPGNPKAKKSHAKKHRKKHRRSNRRHSKRAQQGGQGINNGQGGQK